MGLSDRLRSYFEHRRLERRYFDRSKRSTFTSNAQYVDGEYVHGFPEAGTTSLTHHQPSSHLSQDDAFALSSSSRLFPTSASESHPTAATYGSTQRPPYFASHSSLAMPRAKSFGSSHDRRQSAFIRPRSNDLPLEDHVADIGHDEGRRRKRLQVGMVDESAGDSSDTVGMDDLGNLPPRPQQRSWLARRRSMLGRV